MASYKPISSEEVKVFLYSFSDFVRRCIAFAAASVRNNLIIFFLIITAGAVIGFLQQKNQPAYYESTMVCSFNNLHKKAFGEMVLRLDQLAAQRSYATLAGLLKITPTQARSIIGFDEKNVAGSPLHEDITTEKLPMYFTLRAKNAEVFPAVERGLLYYLNNLPYQKLRSNIEQKSLRERIEFYDASNSKVDTLIHSYSDFVKNKGMTSDTGSGFANVVSLLRYQEELVNKKLGDKKLMELTESVEVVYGFTPAETPANRGNGLLLRALMISFAAGLVIVSLKRLLSDEK